jgi:hypothetical protein
MSLGKKSSSKCNRNKRSRSSPKRTEYPCEISSD